MKTLKITLVILASAILTSCSVQSHLPERVAQDAQWTLEYSIRNEVNRTITNAVMNAGSRLRNAGKWTCPYCGQPNKASNYCITCGHENPYLEWNCPHCGTSHIVGNYCPKCGHPRKEQENTRIK